MDSKEKDTWDKIDIVLKPLGGVAAALIVGIIGSNILQQRQQSEINSRLYTELMSKREEAESALRKDMFVSIIQSFLKPGQAPLKMKEKVLNLELLSYNFHESLNLKPLFVDLRREVLDSISGPKLQGEYLDRLDKVASDVTRKQMLVLEGAGVSFDKSINVKTLQFPVLEEPGKEERSAEEDLALGGVKRNFRLIIQKADTMRKELQISLEVKTLGDSSDVLSVLGAEFGVGYFDFPMIDNTRLSNDQRCAVILRSFSSTSAEITVVYFPGSYSSLKEKPYYEEVIETLRRSANGAEVGKKE